MTETRRNSLIRASRAFRRASTRVGLVLVLCTLVGAMPAGLPVPSVANAAAAAFPTTWSTVPAGTPGGFLLYGVFANMSCAAADDCLSAGYGQTQGGSYEPFAEHWNGSSWAVTPLPIGSPDTLQGLSCLSTSNCWVVGGTEFKGSNPRPVLLHWNGSQWVSAAGPTQPGYLGDVACPTREHCIAVGWNQTSSGSSQTIGEQWDGSSWTSLSVAQPKNQFYSALYGIDCPSPSDCLAVGQKVATAKSPAQILGERWDGKSWSVVNVPNPSLQGYRLDVVLSDLSCPSTTECLAVGYSSPVVFGRSYTIPLVERWNGAKWSMVTLPKGISSFSGMDTPNDVNCVSTSLCWVVGAGFNPRTTGPEPAAAYWNGTTLRMGSVADGTANGSLEAVGCVARAACYAIGHVSKGIKWTVLAEKVQLPARSVLIVRASSALMTYAAARPRSWGRTQAS